MTTSNYFNCLCLLFLVLIVEIVQPTCVLESDFGFKINCAFKKSGLFRVRNLGGIKAHASLGFSLGDELGFEQSLTNLDSSRRRSVSVKNGAPPNFITDASIRPAVKQEKRGKQNRIMMRPMAPATRPNQAAMDKLSTLHRRASSTMRPIVVSGSTLETTNRGNSAITMAKPMPMGVPPFKPLPPKEDTLAVIPIASSTRKSYTPLQVPTSKGPSPVYQSENYPHISQEHVSKMVSQMTALHVAQPLLRITPTPIMFNTPKQYSVQPNANTYAMPTTLHPFVPMPLAAPPTQALTIIPAPVLKGSGQPQFDPSKTPTRIYHNQNSFSFQSKTPTYSAQNQNSYSFQKTNPVSNFIDPVPHQVHDLASMYPAYNTKKVDDYNSITGYGDDTTLKFNKEDINAKIAEIAKAGNISMEAVEAAIALRQQQLLNKYANLPVPTTTSTTTTTTTTTTEEPPIFQQEPEPEIVMPTIPQKPKRNPTSGKVMNAPKEYYPVGYEKNFDDHFQSKVDLPETNFHCGDQKYFPGLYGDESLGCMVFHVCALTDDGLVMKSFLCPESTLFDQTILKCNWWFYVDCKNTRRLYDTNIPVSKSYQLMKALTFFSSYKKEIENDGHNVNPEEVEGIKEAISILENHDNAKKQASSHQAASTIQIVTPLPILDERNNNKIHTTNETSPVYRGNRNYNESSRKSSVKRKSSTPKPEPLLQTSEFKLVTVNADMNFSKKEDSSENSSKRSSSESADRKHRRRMTLKNQQPLTDNTKHLSNTTITLSTPATSTASQELHTIAKNYSVTKQERLTDQLEDSGNINPITLKDAASSLPVKRFYRSSAESTNNKDGIEMTMMNNEKVQIVRPTSMARLVGEHATPTATIKQLDAAILGQPALLRVKKETSPVITPQRSENFRSKPNRYGT